MDKPIVVDPSNGDVTRVWSHWLTVIHGDRPGLTPLLSVKRERAIRKALDAYPVEVCVKAIDGVLLSPFHLGRNARNKRYTDITLILRDPEHIEKFVGLVDAAAGVDVERDAFVHGGSE